jgi:hypothetical protein
MSATVHLAAPPRQHATILAGIITQPMPKTTELGQ